jgi:hypothetical protein
MRALAERGFQGPALGDLAYRGEWPANVGETLGITVEGICPRLRRAFVPAGICWGLSGPSPG